MKKISLFILTLCCFMFMPKVMAASASTVISGTNTVTVGSTTKIYIKLNSSAKIEGADVAFSTSGNITVTNVQIGSGLRNMMDENNRYILYAQNPVASGSTLLVLTVKGTNVGTGTVNVTKLEATVSGETVYSNTASYNITVKAAPTQPTTPTQPSQPTQKPTEDDNSDEEIKQAIKKATTLVEAAEKSLLEDDYEDALASVNKLADGAEKTALLKRLADVKLKIEVEKACGDKTCTTECEECEECGNNNWIILCIVLFACLVIESGYLIYTIRKNR